MPTPREHEHTAPTAIPSAPESPAEELRRLRANAAARQKVEEEENEARELAELRLVEELSLGGSRKRGVDFEVVNTQFGVFGVRVPDPRGIKQWDVATGSATDEDPVDPNRLAGILKHYIVPEKDQERFHLTATDRPGIVTGPTSVGAAFLAL